MVENEGARIFRFGTFEADLAARELRKSGVRLRLQEQPFQVLIMLVERPGQLISREEFRHELWPADTFVDFDHSLNTIINKLREVLGDSASNPRFIETLARRGYRFLPPVEVRVNERNAHLSVDVSTAGEPLDKNIPVVSQRQESFLTSAHDLPVVRSGYIRALFVLIQIMYLSFYITALARLPAVETVLERGLGASASAINVLLILSAAIGIPIRLYLLSYMAFDVDGLSRKFLRLFTAVLVLDEIWALAPFLLAAQIGLGFALAITAALTYVPFAQRTLVLMRDRSVAAL